MKRLIALLISYALALYPISSYATESTGTITSATFTVSADSATPIANPDRYEAYWAGGDLVSSYDSASVAAGFTAGYRLLGCYVGLSAFRTSSISGAWLTSFQSRLDSIRSAGMKCVLFFNYDDNSGTGVDATATQIVSHLAQLKPYFRANADVIPYARAGFIGAYGEWWGSQSGNTCGFQSGTTTCATANANKLLVKNALMDAFHPYTFVQFRYPADNMIWYPTVLTSNQKYNGTSQSRSGFHNDCMLSGVGTTPNEEDTGTWRAGGSGTSFSIAAKKAYMDSMTSYTPYGGETTNGCDAPLRTSCAEARTDFSRWHLTWFNTTASSMSSFRNAWSSGGCVNELANLMGYRLQYSEVSHQSTATAGQTVTFTVLVRNVGYSRVHQPYKIQAVMVRSGGGASDVVCNSRVDLRNIPPQSLSYSTVTVNCATGIAGTWNVHIRVPSIFSTTQSAAFAVRPANTNSGGQTWDSTNYRWTTGTTIVVS
jgi:hypothetical protein